MNPAITYGVGRVTVTPLINFAIYTISAGSVYSLGDWLYGVLNENADIDSSGEGDNCPPAKDVSLDKKDPRKDRIGGGLSVDDAVDAVKKGGDIIAKDRSTAKEIAEKVGNGQPTHDLGHIPRGGNNRGRSHYHPNSGNGTDNRGGGFGHIFF